MQKLCTLDRRGGGEPFIWFLNLSSWSQGIDVLGKLYLLRQGTEIVFNQI